MKDKLSDFDAFDIFMLLTHDNQKVTIEQLWKIRNLDDFDLIMLISDIHDHGWPTAERTLAMMPEKRAP
jgi:hypothetical protein